MVDSIQRLRFVCHCAKHIASCDPARTDAVQSLGTYYDTMNTKTSPTRTGDIGGQHLWWGGGDSGKCNDLPSRRVEVGPRGIMNVG